MGKQPLLKLKSAYMLERVFKTQQFQLLCDCQELACTSKDSNRRVNIKETSFRNMNWAICWVIDKNVSEPTLVTPIRFAEIIECL